jgi:hypothetical protein
MVLWIYWLSGLNTIECGAVMELVDSRLSLADIIKGCRAGKDKQCCGLKNTGVFGAQHF